MKKNLIAAFLLCFSMVAAAQSKYTLADVRNARSLIWFGLDFSQARFYGPFVDKVKIKDTDLQAWNTSFTSDKGFLWMGIDLKKLLGMNYVFADLSVVNDHNRDIAVEDLFGNTDKEKPSWNEDRVIKMIRKYEPKEKDGIGLVMIVESFDKTTEMATIWVTYFDPSTREVIRTRKYFGKASGSGAKHWPNAVVNILNELRKNSIY